MKMAKTKRTLGKISSELITTLSSQDRVIFTISDAQKITKKCHATTRKLINRLIDKKWLIRLVPGKYLIVPLSAGENAEFSENWYVVAKHLIEPNLYYLSHYSALDIHEMTTQPLMTVYITTPVRRRVSKVLGASFLFHYAKQSKFWGIEDVWVKPTERVRVSDLERTIVDCLNNPTLCGGISELAKGLWIKRNDINYSKLKKYVERFGSKAVAKRLGFLLELYGVADKGMIEKLRKFVTPSFVLLDSSLPATGKYQSSWFIRVNLDPKELKEIVKA
jgi:predicted transcriptional regulator of viral defense system